MNVNEFVAVCQRTQPIVIDLPNWKGRSWGNKMQVSAQEVFHLLTKVVADRDLIRAIAVFGSSVRKPKRFLGLFRQWARDIDIAVITDEKHSMGNYKANKTHHYVHHCFGSYGGWDEYRAKEEAFDIEVAFDIVVATPAQFNKALHTRFNKALHTPPQLFVVLLEDHNFRRSLLRRAHNQRSGYQHPEGRGVAGW